MNKLYVWILIVLSGMLSACSGQSDCDDSAVTDQIEQSVLNYIHDYKFISSVKGDYVEKGMAGVKSVTVKDIFNLRKLKNGTRTCKAKIIVQIEDGYRAAEMDYSVINYEDGFKVDLDRGTLYLLANAAFDYFDKKAANIWLKDLQAKAAQHKADLDAFLAKSLHGNVCADHFNQETFKRDFVDVDNYGMGHIRMEDVAEETRKIIAGSKVEVVDIKTPHIRPSDEEHLETSKTIYRCTAVLQLVLPDGSVVTNGDIEFRAESQADKLIGYYVGAKLGDKFNIDNAGSIIAEKVEFHQ